METTSPATRSPPAKPTRPRRRHESADDSRASDSSSGSDSDRDTEDEETRSDEDRDRVAEDFAREHDPEQHDVEAGEEFRQEGDWTADDAGGPQVWDDEGNLVEGNAAGQPESASSAAQANEANEAHDTADGRRTSALDEIRDGGYGVGSAAPIDDGAVPLGHPVKAWEDTKTFVTPEHAKYAEAEPHVWFADAYAAGTSWLPRRRPDGHSRDVDTDRQVGTGSDRVYAPDARSSAWCVGPMAVPSVRLPGIPRLRA